MARQHSRAASVDDGLVVAQPGRLRDAVLSRLPMNEETIQERIAYAHEPRKLPVVLRR
jgi:hypothetical protein